MFLYTASTVSGFLGDHFGACGEASSVRQFCVTPRRPHYEPTNGGHIAATSRSVPRMVICKLSPQRVPWLGKSYVLHGVRKWLNGEGGWWLWSFAVPTQNES